MSFHLKAGKSQLYFVKFEEYGFSLRWLGENQRLSEFFTLQRSLSMRVSMRLANIIPALKFHPPDPRFQGRSSFQAGLPASRPGTLVLSQLVDGI